MNEMLSYTSSMLSMIADFLGTEPIIYVVGFLLGISVIKMIKEIMGRG